MKHMLCSALYLLSISGTAVADSVSVLAHLPLQLSNANTKVTFEVDSTWHLIEGRANAILGEIAASDEGAVRADVRLAVKAFDTGNSMRDDKLREVMAADQQPEVVFALKEFQPECSLAAVELEQLCKGIARGTLTIRGVTKEIAFPVRLTAHADRVSLTGGDTLLWREYGVEDPSILVARLAEKVAIQFEIEIPQ